MNEQVGFDLIYLTSCALHGKVPSPERIAAMDLDTLYRMAQFHSITALVAFSLESGLVIAPSEFARWKQAKEKAIRKNILLDAEREQILSFMENNGIWYAPLKGIILKELYPRYGMRQMADNDILYDATYCRELRRFMESRGYKTMMFGRYNHDEYEKPPVYNFEMHTSLFSPAHDNKLVQYYSDVKNKLLPDDINNYGYHFTDEDFYVYITAHSYKHFKGEGTGLRTLVDCYLYWQKKGDLLDLDYIDAELDKLGIADYERMCRSLSNKLFSCEQELDSDCFTGQEREELNYFLYSGAYGTQSNNVKNKLQEIRSSREGTRFTKLKYCAGRIFPSLEIIESVYPFFYRHKLLIPALWIFRLFKAVSVSRNKIKNEISVLNAECKGQD